MFSVAWQKRLETKFLEEKHLVDLVVGPDAYRDLPNELLKETEDGRDAINVILSKEETYADINPVRQVSAVRHLLPSLEVAITCAGTGSRTASGLRVAGYIRPFRWT